MDKLKVPENASTQLIDSYLRLSEQLYNQYNDRRKLEWRINVALWTLLAAVTYLCVSENKHLECFTYWSLLIIPIHFIWIVKIVSGEIREQNLSRSYRKKAERILNYSPDKPSQTDPDQFPQEKISEMPEEESKMPKWLEDAFLSYWWWPIVQLSTTTLLCFSFIKLAS